MPSPFALLGVPGPLCATLARRGIAEPFPIQAATLPDALAGRDVTGKAPTGSGKTLAFGLVIAARVTGAGRAEPHRPRALVLAPTRELAAQVQRELQALVDRSAGPVAAVYGGVGYGPQRRALARGASVVVACPGRLEDLVASGDVVLDRAALVVLDEADRMADMGFLPAVRRLVDLTPADRQTLLFSATLDGDVDVLVRRYQREPARHEVATPDDDPSEVTHLFWRSRRVERARVTADVVRGCGPTVVFCRTRHGADRVARQLGQAGVRAAAIHGRRTQAQRDRALADFAKGRVAALVATDVAARGIHVDGVACVVHFDLPADPKDYVHRSGRTGRAGADGLVVALVAAEDGDRPAQTLLRQLGRPEPIVPAGSLLPVVPGAAGSAVPAGRIVPAAAPEPTRSARAAAPAEPLVPAVAGEVGGRMTADPAEPERPAVTPSTRRASRRRAERPRPRSRPAAGTVTVFHPQRGYGFIARRGGGDVFVHVSNLAAGHQRLRPGQRVRFEVASGKRGDQAINVRLA